MLIADSLLVIHSGKLGNEYRSHHLITSHLYLRMFLEMMRDIIEGVKECFHRTVVLTSLLYHIHASLEYCERHFHYELQ